MAGFFETTRIRWAFEDYLERLERANPSYVYGVDQGRDYLKVWRDLRSMGGTGIRSKSALSFIGRDGSVYKAESFKKRGRRIGDLATLGGNHSSSRDSVKITQTPIAYWEPTTKRGSRLTLYRNESSRSGTSYSYKGDGTSGQVRALTNREAIDYVESKIVPMQQGRLRRQ